MGMNYNNFHDHLPFFHNMDHSGSLHLFPISLKSESLETIQLSSDAFPGKNPILLLPFEKRDVESEV